jgi:hypothetical protein
MGFENTNFIDDLGHDIKEPNFFLGCLSVFVIGALILGGIAAVTGIYTYFTLSKQSGPVVYKDGAKTITFIPPKGWACFNANASIGPYVLNKVFTEKAKYHAVLEKVSYKKVRYTKRKMMKDPGEMAKQVRAALKAKEMKDALLKTEKADIEKAYTGFKRVKCVYKNGYGYAVYKKEGLARCYYFKALQNFIITMAYIYEDSAENREEAQKEEPKLAEMWENAFKPQSKKDGSVKTLSGPVGKIK